VIVSHTNLRNLVKHMSWRFWAMAMLRFDGPSRLNQAEREKEERKKPADAQPRTHDEPRVVYVWRLMASWPLTAYP
jgi:hypothetical protein